MDCNEKHQPKTKVKWVPKANVAQKDDEGFQLVIKRHTQVPTKVIETVTFTDYFDALVSNEVNDAKEVENGLVQELEKHGKEREPPIMNG